MPDYGSLIRRHARHYRPARDDTTTLASMPEEISLFIVNLIKLYAHLPGRASRHKPRRCHAARFLQISRYFMPASHMPFSPRLTFGSLMIIIDIFTAVILCEAQIQPQCPAAQYTSRHGIIATGVHLIRGGYCAHLRAHVLTRR